MIKALLEQNQALNNGLLTNERYRERSLTRTEISEFLVMPNFLNMLLEFDGYSTSQIAEDWLSTIEGVTKLQSKVLLSCINGPDTFRIETARSRMTGPANNWFTHRKFRNWDDFLSQFKHTFVGSKLNVVERMKNMLNQAQGESEMVADYFHHKARLCRELDLSSNERKQQIVAGLKSRDLWYYLLARHHTDEDSPCYDLKLFAQINDARSQYFKKSQRSNANEAINSKSSTTRSAMPTVSRDTSTKKFTKLPPRNDKYELFCLYCSTYGHESRYCPKPEKSKCTNCGNYGHEENTCFTNTPVELVVSFKLNIINEKYFFDALVNSQPSPSIFRYRKSIMRESDAVSMKLSIASMPNTVEIWGYGDGRLLPLGVVTIQLLVDCATVQIPVI